MISRDEVAAAEARIRPFVRETLLERSKPMSDALGAEVYLKLENLQHTGSFKLRGALSKILAIGIEATRTTVVCASSGNHGIAVAYAMKQIGGRGIVYVPRGASEVKVAAIRKLGAEIRFHGTDTAETEAEARAFADRNGSIYVAPYNDIEVMAGQGTIAVEICRQLPSIRSVFVPVGGGGLIGGMAAYMKATAPHVRVVGCSARASRAMAASVEAGRVVEIGPHRTLSDGTAGGLEPDTMTFDPCRRWVDAWIDVSEAEIASSMKSFAQRHRMVVEGAAGVAIAAVCKTDPRAFSGPVAVIVSGGNIDSRLIEQVLQ